MSLQHELSYSVVHLTMRRGTLELATGSAFLYLRDGKYYIVTAWHNLTGRHGESLQPLHSRCALPDNFIAYMPLVMTLDGQTGYIRLPIRFDLEGDRRSDYWIHETQWPRVDVAVVPFDPWDDHHHEVPLSDGTTREWEAPLFSRSPDGAISRLAVITDTPLQGDLANASSPGEMRLEVGEDLFLLGFPRGIVDQTMTPLWKRASIATLARTWERQHKFLVDCASREGMSGGPAIYFDRRGDVPVLHGRLNLSSPVAMLCGVYVGRVGDSEFGAQVGVVWNKDVIDEIIRDERVAPRSEDLELDAVGIRSAITTIIDRCTDSADLTEESNAVGYMCHEVMSLIDGRSDPGRVRAEMLRLISARKHVTSASDVDG